MGVEQGYVVKAAVTMLPGRHVDAVTSDGPAVSFWPRPNGGLRFGWDGRPIGPAGRCRPALPGRLPLGAS